jgi:hypothetical protein
VDAVKLGQAGLVGWRRKVGERIADPISRRTRLSPDQAMAVLGAIFFLLTLRHFLHTLRAANEARD